MKKQTPINLGNKISKIKQSAIITNEILAQELTSERQNKKLSMREFAERLGTPHSFVAKTENQGRRLDVGEFIYYCREMGLDEVELFTKLAKSLNG